MTEKRRKPEKKERNAYIAWDQKSESSVSSSSRSDEEANLCLMANDEDHFSVHTSDTESMHQPDIDQMIEAFNEMHQEAQRLAVSNNKLKSTIRVQYEKLVSIQTELNDLKVEHEKLKNAYEVSGCMCPKGSENTAKYKQLETLYETFKNLILKNALSCKLKSVITRTC